MKLLFLTIAEFSKFPSYKRAIGIGHALSCRGDMVYIAVYDCPENRLRMKEESPRCIPIWVTSRNPFVEAWQKLFALYKIKPDVVFSLSYSLRNLSYLSWLIPRGIKKVIEFSELYSVYPKRSIKWKIKETLACIENGYILCASKFLKKHFDSEVKKLHLCRSIIYLPYAYPDYLRPNDTDKRNCKTIIFMASLWKAYGIYDVMTAVAMLIEDGLDVELEVLGSGPEKDNVDAWVEKRNLNERIHIRGYVPESDLNHYFSKAAVFVAPLHETVQDIARCPSKVYYYIPYNKPIVTCRLGDPYDVFGDEGYYYMPDDIVDLAMMLRRGLSDSSTFSYQIGFVESHSWNARAITFAEWVDNSKN